MIEIGLSFLEGFALILSPCILPVLPIVLGASIEGGKKRPFGIIIGFVFAFTAFALFARQLVLWLGLDLDIIKYVSLALLALFGFVLIFEGLSAKFSMFTQRLATAGDKASRNARDGFLSGIGIGALIGLVWTPCAGPILAAALVQIIRQETTLQAMFLLAAFAFGAGVPMLLIALTGRKFMEKLKFFTQHAESIRKTFGVMILLAVAFIAMGGNVEKLFATPKSPDTQTSHLENALDTPYPAPEFKGLDGWLNSNPLLIASLRGKVVLVDFWTYSCINCIRTLPYLTKWDQTYRDQGLVIVGIHSPEFEFEKNKANVANALKAHQIKYPVALDNRLDTWTAFNNRYWPAHYLIDQKGRVVYTHFGEGNYTETENNIRHLLGLNKQQANVPDPKTISRDQSPETYLGYARAANFASREGMTQEETKNYTPPKFLRQDHWALGGRWKIEAEHITSASQNASLLYNFTARKVFLVLGTQDGKPIKVTLKLNGEPNGTLTVGQHTLYELVNQGKAQNGLLEITATEPGLEAYAFTFGS